MLRSGSVLFVAGLLVAACGTTPEERGLTGAGIGAAGGAVIGAVTGLSVVEGALIGAGAAGLTGALTDESQINLGKPIWDWGKDDAAAAPAAPAAAAAPTPDSNRRLVRDLQVGLAELGYDPGPIDGVFGPRTRGAIRQYQQQHGLPDDGEPSYALAAHIQEASGAVRAEATAY